jgi:purine nucleoside permease
MPIRRTLQLYALSGNFDANRMCLARTAASYVRAAQTATYTQSLTMKLQTLTFHTIS